MSIKIGNKVEFNWLQLVVFSMGVLLILAMIGYLTYQSVTMGNTPPKVEVSTE